MRVMPNGMNMYVDIDSTLIEWDIPDNATEADIVTITCRGIEGQYCVNKHNINFLMKLAQRSHCIILWSKAGSEWAEAVAIALNIQDIVWACMSKPHYYLDDIKDTSSWMGEHRFYDFDGNKHYHYSSLIDKTKENK